MKLKEELLPISILTIFLILVIYFLPIVVLRVILGLPVVLFFPGYTLLAALFPKKGELKTVERVALSFVLSILLVALIGLILNYTPWGIRLHTVLFSNALLIITASLVAWFRRRQLPPEERPSFSFRLNLSEGTPVSKIYQGLFVAILVAILAGLGILGYIVGTNRVGERFTQFYLLDPEGKSGGYPEELQVGEEAEVIVGIYNHEQENMSYWIEVIVDGVASKETGLILLGNGEKCEGEISFTPTRVGADQKVEFLLYKHGEDQPYQKLYLWIDVRSSE